MQSSSSNDSGRLRKLVEERERWEGIEIGRQDERYPPLRRLLQICADYWPVRFPRQQQQQQTPFIKIPNIFTLPRRGRKEMLTHFKTIFWHSSRFVSVSLFVCLCVCAWAATALGMTTPGHMTNLT